MADISLENITVTYEKNGVTALKNLSMTARDREFIAVLGPSGCGKTTLLRVISGLQFPTEGKVIIDGRERTNEPPYYRNAAMMFQNFPLYPNMTVYENIMFTYTHKYRPTSGEDDRLKATVTTLELERLLDRKPATLSGGERQRVALARAMLRVPDFFLFDEPLSNLDPLTRDGVRDAIKQLHNRVKVPIIYVTHDQHEAMSMATRVVVMRAGEVQQSAAPDALYKKPCNRYVAGFIGYPRMNFLPAVVVGDSHGGYALNTAGNLLRLAPEVFSAAITAGCRGKEVVLGIRPEHLSPSVAQNDVKTAGELAARIVSVEGVGADLRCYADVGGVRVLSAGVQNRTLRIGDRVNFNVARGDIHLFDCDTEANLLCPPEKEGDAR